MLEKIKTAIKYVALPLLALFGLFYYMFTKITSLQSQLKQTEAEKDIAETVSKLNEAKTDADQKEQAATDAINDFKSAMADYERGAGRLPTDSK